MLSISVIFAFLIYGQKCIAAAIIPGKALVLPKSAPVVSCRPDLIPALSKPGFCANLNQLDDLCGTLEISDSKDCPTFEGNFCCYQSLYQGNALQQAAGSPATTVRPVTTSKATTPTTRTATPAAKNMPVRSLMVEPFASVKSIQVPPAVVPKMGTTSTTKRVPTFSTKRTIPPWLKAKAKML